MTRTTSHGPLLDTVALLRWPGSQADVVLDEALEGAETSVARACRIHGTLVAESMADSLAVTGLVQVEWEGICRRCLEAATGELEVDVREIYERNPVDGETYELTDDRVDLRPMLAELVTLSLPLAPLCSDDCAGPAPDAFPAQPAGTLEEEEAPAGDPRWAALDALTFDDDG